MHSCPQSMLQLPWPVRWIRRVFPIVHEPFQLISVRKVAHIDGHNDATRLVFAGAIVCRRCSVHPVFTNQYPVVTFILVRNMKRSWVILA